MIPTKERSWNEVAGTLVALIYILLLGSLVFQAVWGWFVVPTFGARPLSLPMAIGLRTVVGALRGAGKAPEKEEALGPLLWRGTMHFLMVLAMAYGAHLWLGWVR